MFYHPDDEVLKKEWVVCGGTNLEPVYFGFIVRFGETREHKIVGILEEAVGIVWISVFGVWIRRDGRLAGVRVDDTQLNDGRRVNGATVNWESG